MFKENKSRVKWQFFATFSCNIMTIAYGAINSWASLNFVTLQNAETGLPSGPLSLEEATLVMSIFGIGGFIGNIAILYISSRFGSKTSVLMLCVPHLISLLLIAFGTNVYFLYVGRILSGFVAGGLWVSISIYVVEIADEKYRGAMNSIFDPCFNGGVLFGYFIGSYFPYNVQAEFQLIFPIVCMILLCQIPESPLFLQKQGNEKLAMKSMKFFKNVEILPEADKFIPTVDKVVESDTKVTAKDFFTRSSRKAALISLISIFLNMFCGVMIVVGFAPSIFTKAQSSLSATEASVLITIVQIIANFIAVQIIDRINRRTMYITSAVITSLGFLWFGFHQLYLSDDPAFNWIPVVSVAIIILISHLGLISIPYLAMVEIFPPKIKHASVAICVAITWILGIFTNSAYPIAQERYGLHVCLFFFAGICLLNALHGYFLLIETRGKSNKSILNLLEG